MTKQNLLIITTACLLLMACGEDGPSATLESITPTNQDAIFKLNKTDSDLVECATFGYTDTLHFRVNSSSGLKNFDDNNYLKIASIHFGNPRKNVVVYEFEDAPNSQWPVQSNSYQAFYHDNLKQLLLGENCIYDLEEN